MIFAQIDQEALLVMNAELTPLEFQLFTVYKVEEFLGEGVCRLNVTKIKEKYRFKNYDSLSHANKRLRLKKWILEHPEGIVCQTDFTQTVKLLSETEEKKKLRNSKSEESTENFQVTGNFQVADLEKLSPELRNSKLPTENFQVNDLEILSSARAFKGNNLKTLDTDKKKEEEENPASSFSASASNQNFQSGTNSAGKANGNRSGTHQTTEVPRGGEGKTVNTKPKSGATFDDETRPDLSDEQFLEHLAALAENRGIDIPGLYLEMQRWCKKNRHTPSRGRFLNWLVVERKSKPMSLEIPEEKKNGAISKPGDQRKPQGNDAGSRNAQRVNNTNAAISELVRRGAARRAVSGGNDESSPKNK
jgi:hypothetical protein